MKSLCVLLVLALAAFASAEEVAMGQELAVADAQTAEVADMQAEAEVAVDEEEGEAEDEAVEEAEDEDESEEEAEEEEFSLIEAEAQAETDEERKNKLNLKAKKSPFGKKHKKHHKKHHNKKVVLAKVDGKRRAKIVRNVRAPRALRDKPFKFHSERIFADTRRGPNDPEMEKLDLALAAVKEDILSTNKQITDERKWVIAVAKIIASYNDKMKRVEAHIIALRKEMKALYRKKKQIENLKLQRALEAKLKEARDELATLSGSLKHVRVKQGELNKSGADLRATIAGIQQQLAKLRGQRLRKPKAAVRGRKCGKGKRYSRKAKRCVPRRAGRAGRRHARKGRRAGKKF